MTDLASFRRVLVLAPHTDDGELGCGATVVRLLEGGADVHYCAFSTCEESVPDGFPKDVLHSEVREATGRLGIPPENLVVLGFRVRRFPAQRQEILERIIELRGRIEPDLVLVPGTSDVHQDHRVIHEEAERAFKRVTLLGWEMPWNEFETRTTVLVRIDPAHLDRKIEALRAYESQRHRGYVTEEFLRNLAQIRGVQAGWDLAEAFEVLRWMVP